MLLYFAQRFKKGIPHYKISKVKSYGLNVAMVYGHALSNTVL